MTSISSRPVYGPQLPETPPAVKIPERLIPPGLKNTETFDLANVNSDAQITPLNRGSAQEEFRLVQDNPYPSQTGKDMLQTAQENMEETLGPVGSNLLIGAGGAAYVAQTGKIKISHNVSDVVGLPNAKVVLDVRLRSNRAAREQASDMNQLGMALLRPDIVPTAKVARAGIQFQANF